MRQGLTESTAHRLERRQPFADTWVTGMITGVVQTGNTHRSAQRRNSSLRGPRLGAAAGGDRHGGGAAKGTRRTGLGFSARHFGLGRTSRDQLAIVFLGRTSFAVRERTTGGGGRSDAVGNPARVHHYQLFLAVLITLGVMRSRCFAAVVRHSCTFAAVFRRILWQRGSRSSFGLRECVGLFPKFLFEGIDGLPDGHFAQTRPVLSVSVIVRLQLVTPPFAGHIREARVQQGGFAVVIQQRHVHGELIYDRNGDDPGGVIALGYNQLHIFERFGDRLVGDYFELKKGVLRISL
mmetsp:Transcript_44781/g.78163  ORF Transcript_44781/g.78163 Transcript_44781/m.78163 type:complete len:293 (-) Transcript_44781:1215-2093(-)